MPNVLQFDAPSGGGISETPLQLTTADNAGTVILQPGSPTGQSGNVALQGTLTVGNGLTSLSNSGNALNVQSTGSGSAIILPAGNNSAPTVSMQEIVSQTQDLISFKDSNGIRKAGVKPSGIFDIIGLIFNGATWGSGTAFPSSPASGQRFLRTDFRCWFVYDGSAWQQEDVPAWTSFPSSPIVGLRVFRSDRYATYTYNGTYWLTEPKPWSSWYAPGLTARPWAAGTYTGFAVLSLPDSTYGFYLNSLSFVYFSNSTTNASNYFTFTANKNAGGVVTSIGSFNLTAQGANTTVIIQTNTAYTIGSVDKFRFDLATGAGTPGSIFADLPVLTYQLIG